MKIFELLVSNCYSVSLLPLVLSWIVSFEDNSKQDKALQNRLIYWVST